MKLSNLLSICVALQCLILVGCSITNPMDTSSSIIIHTEEVTIGYTPPDTYSLTSIFDPQIKIDSDELAFAHWGKSEEGAYLFVGDNKFGPYPGSRIHHFAFGRTSAEFAYSVSKEGHTREEYLYINGILQPTMYENILDMKIHPFSGEMIMTIGKVRSGGKGKFDVQERFIKTKHHLIEYTEIIDFVFDDSDRMAATVPLKQDNYGMVTYLFHGKEVKKLDDTYGYFYGTGSINYGYVYGHIADRSLFINDEIAMKSFPVGAADIIISQDGEHYGLVTMYGSIYFDGNLLSKYSTEVIDFQLSSNGEVLAYIAPSDKKTFSVGNPVYYFVVHGSVQYERIKSKCKGLRCYRGIDNLVLSPDGEFVAYVVQNEQSHTLYINGIERKPYSQIKNLTYNKDKQAFTYNTYDQDKNVLLKVTERVSSISHK